MFGSRIARAFRLTAISDGPARSRFTWTFSAKPHGSSATGSLSTARTGAWPSRRRSRPPPAWQAQSHHPRGHRRLHRRGSTSKSCVTGNRRDKVLPSLQAIPGGITEATFTSTSGASPSACSIAVKGHAAEGPAGLRHAEKSGASATRAVASRHRSATPRVLSESGRPTMADLQFYGTGRRKTLGRPACSSSRAPATSSSMANRSTSSSRNETGA